MKRRTRLAFSLVEILIVVMILGILAAIAVPKFSNASAVARESALKDDLRLMRTQLGVYKAQHSLFPGYPGGDEAQTPTAQVALDQLLLYTNSAGNTSATSTALYNLGPYLPAIPPNPMSGRTDLKILGPAEAFTADGTTGWLYQPSTGLIAANLATNDSAGLPLVGY